MKRLGPCSPLEEIWFDLLARHCGRFYSVDVDDVPTVRWNDGWRVLVALAHVKYRPMEECVGRAAKLICRG